MTFCRPTTRQGSTRPMPSRVGPTFAPLQPIERCHAQPEPSTRQAGHKQGALCIGTVRRTHWPPARLCENPRVFEDLVEARVRNRSATVPASLRAVFEGRLAILTCIDPRIDPVALFGLHGGDVAILRNAGARVTDDVIRSLVIATSILGVNRCAVIQHTDCALVGRSDADVKAQITSIGGVAAANDEFLTMPEDQVGAIQSDISALRSSRLLPSDLEIGGFILDLESGDLRRA
jgi:carbonic anhydrase